MDVRSSFSTACESSRDMEAESGDRCDGSNMRTSETGELQMALAGQVWFRFCAAEKVACSRFHI